jgi:hypothetical protein
MRFVGNVFYTTSYATKIQRTAILASGPFESYTLDTLVHDRFVTCCIMYTHLSPLKRTVHESIIVFVITRAKSFCRCVLCVSLTRSTQLRSTRRTGHLSTVPIQTESPMLSTSLWCMQRTIHRSSLSPTLFARLRFAHHSVHPSRHLSPFSLLSPSPFSLLSPSPSPSLCLHCLGSILEQHGTCDRDNRSPP